MPKDSLTITDNRTGRTYEVPDRRRHHPGHGPPPDQGRGRRLRPDDVRPGLHEHGRVPERDHLHRRRPGHPAVPRLSDRAAGRAGDASSRWRTCLIEGELPTKTQLDQVDGDDQVPHLRPHQHHQVPRGVPLRRPPDGHAARRGGRALHLLSRRQEHPRPGQPLAPAGAAAGQGAHHRGLRLPPLPRAAVRVPGQRSRLHRQLRQHDVQHRRPAQAEQGAAARARDPADPPRRSRAELLHQRGTRRRARRTWTRSPPSRPASRRSTDRSTAGPTRPCSPMLDEIGDKKNIPAFIEEVKGGARPADGLRPPGLQVVRPAGQADQAGGRRRLRARPGSIPKLEIALELERIALEDEYFIKRKLYPNVDFYSGLIYQAMGYPDRVLHRALRAGPDAGMAGPVGGDAAGQGPEDRPAAADLHRRATERPFVPIEKRWVTMTDQLDTLLSEQRRFPPPPEFAARANAHGGALPGRRARPGRVLGRPGARARLDPALGPGARLEAAARQVVRRRQAQRLGQLPRPAPRPGPRRNKAAIIWEGEPGDRRVLTYWELAREVEPLRQRAQAPRRQAGRPGGDLPADGARGRDRHARLRPDRRGALGGLRRLLGGVAARPDQRRRRPSRSSPPTAATAAARSLPLKRFADEALAECALDPSTVIVVRRRAGGRGRRVVRRR